MLDWERKTDPHSTKRRSGGVERCAAVQNLGRQHCGNADNQINRVTLVKSNARASNPRLSRTNTEDEERPVVGGRAAGKEKDEEQPNLQRGTCEGTHCLARIA